LEQRQKMALKRSIMRFHSPDVAEQIVQHPEAYHSIRQGAVRCIVILFSDIRGYTSMSEVLTAQQMVTQLNEYFERMVAVVFQRQGAVDKFIGDAMMAVWGRFRNDSRELELADDARQAVDSALAMRRELAILNERWREKNITELAIGIGIHQGEAVVGEIGSQERAELTAIGDCVNLSSRLEGATKEYGVDLLISDVVQRRVDAHFICRSVDLVRVKGKTQPVEVFTVMGPREMSPPSGLEHFTEGMRCYREGLFGEALDLFLKAKAGGMDDYLTDLFVKRSTEMTEHPPESWEGVYTMTKK
jgi:adenylate cyclase